GSIAKKVHHLNEEVIGCGSLVLMSAMREGAVSAIPNVSTVLLTLALILLSTFPGSAQDVSPQCKPNGCGPSGWLGSLVPDWIGRCQLKKACDQHDVCYSRCDCGDLIGKPECQGRCRDKLDRKRACDRELEKDIV